MPEGYTNVTINRLYKDHKDRKEQKEADPVKNNKSNISCSVPPNAHRAYLSASATVEAAIVMPLFIYAVTAVMYIMQMVSVQLHIQESLYNECRLLARYAYLSECIKNGDDRDGIISESSVSEAFPEKSILEKGLDLAAVYTLFIRETGADYAEKMHIAGGNAGYIMAGSKILDGNNDIELEVRYVIKNPFDIFGIAARTFTQKVCVSAWLGSDMYAKDNDTDGQAEEYVYMTQGGEVYHTDRSCTYIDITVRSVPSATVQSLRNKNGGIYYRCEYCGMNYGGMPEVYITEYGDRYHSDSNCPRIKRDVIKILKTAVRGIRQCSKCGK